MTKKSADILVVAFDGNQVYFNDVTTVSEETLAKIEPHLTGREAQYLSAAKAGGYSVAQQFVFALTAENTYRAHQLLCEV